MTHFLFRSRWIFLGSVVAVLLLALGVVLHFQYRCVSTTAVQIVSNRVARDLGIDRSDPALSPAQQNARAFNQYMEMPSFRQAVLDKLNDARLLHMPIDPDPQHEDPRLALLIVSMEASASSEHLMTITLQWDDAKDANLLLKAFRDEFTLEMGQEASIGSKDTIGFLNQEMIAYRQKLDHMDMLAPQRKQSSAWQVERDAGRARYRKMLELREDFVLRNKLQTVSASSTYKNAFDPYAVSQPSPTQRFGILVAAPGVGLLFGLLLAGAREAGRRRAARPPAPV